MKCRYLIVHAENRNGDTYPFFGDCIEATCASWDKEKKCCVDVKAAIQLNELWISLDNLAREINNAVLRNATPTHKG